VAAVTGIGGVLLRATDPDALFAWYEEHLGMTRSPGGFVFAAGAPRGDSVIAFLARDDTSFPSAQPVMLDLQVDDLDGLLDRLEAAGVAVDPKRDSYDFGRFGWFTDPEGNRVELWEPAAEG
jgi:predicted enzyme related to lactoylglutathione lyase